MKKDYAFSKKIECIFTHIANSNIDNLVNLFILPQKADLKSYFDNRKMHIQRAWLKNQNSAFIPRTFKTEFIKYPFYQHTSINGKALFTDADEFLQLPLEEFCNKIYDYLKYNSLLKKYREFQFNYFYLYRLAYKNPKKYNISEYKIEYLNKISANEILINVRESRKGSLEYRGKII